jgi:hypothetical protein
MDTIGWELIKKSQEIHMAKHFWFNVSNINNANKFKAHIKERIKTNNMTTLFLFKAHATYNTNTHLSFAAAIKVLSSNILHEKIIIHGHQTFSW